jgi:MFS transporter, DHA1 family, inner membrane transport protein
MKGDNPGNRFNSQTACLRPWNVKEETIMPDADGKSKRMPFALWALGVGTFGMGTGEFVVAGLLLNIASSLRVSTSAAGLLVSAYALGVIIGAPTVTMLTRGLPQKTTLLVVLGLFIRGNLLCATAPDYGVLMFARFMTGLAQASFFGLGSVIAVELVPEGKKASAIAVMFTGVTLASIVGVPIGTLIGQSFGWRSTFFSVTGLGILAVVSVSALLPTLVRGEVPGVGNELRVIRQRQVLLAFGMTILGNGAVVAVFTYIAPILVQITGFSMKAISPILLLFGLGFVVGNTIGGKLADRWLMRSLIGMLVALSLVLLGFSVAVHYSGTALVAVFFFGVTAYGIVPGLQLRAVTKAVGAPTLGAAFNIASFNIGGAAGALLGGLVLRSHWGLGSIPLVGVLLAFSSVATSLLSVFMDRKSSSRMGDFLTENASVRICRTGEE